MTRSDRERICCASCKRAARSWTGTSGLSSGRHSNRFVQKFRILEDPPLVERVAARSPRARARSRRRSW